MSRERAFRVVIGTLGLDQHEVGAMAISQLLIRHGFEVVYLGRFNTPSRLAAVAEQEDADIVGVSVHSWEYTAYADELVARCRAGGVGLALGGSVLTERDQADLLSRGVDAVFGAYASEEDVVRQLEALGARVRARDEDAIPQVTAPAHHGDRLAGRVVVVTGAAHGLGRAYTLELCRQGAAVVANDLDEVALKELATLVEDLPGDVELVVQDVTEKDAPAALVATALSRYGQLHAAVANAGALRSGPLLRMADEDLQLLLDVHVTAAFRLMREAGRYWRTEAKAGRAVDATVVLTTSAAGLYGFRAEAGYSAAKSAIAALTTVAADELQRYGVTVNALAPTARTRLTPWMGEVAADSVADDELAAEHVAPVLAWLLGPEAREVTGRTIEVGAGRVSIPTAWQPGRPFRLPPLMKPDAASQLMSQVLAASPPPRTVLTANFDEYDGLPESAAGTRP